MKIKILTVVAGLMFAATINAQDFKPQNLKDNLNNLSLTKIPAVSSSANKTETTGQTQTNGTYVRPDANQRFKRYIKSMVGPTSLARNVVGAGYSTWRNSPEEWGDNWEGFGRRVASGAGKNAIKQTTIYALDESFKLDSRFYRSNKKDFGSRLGNALISPVTARRPNGKRTIGVPRLVGTFGAGVIAYETWYPKRYDYKDGLRSGAISLGFNAAFNIFKEFVWKK